MFFPSDFETNEESLKVLEEKFTPVAEDRFLYSLQSKKWSIEDIHRFNSSLGICLDYVRQEYERMKELKDVYNLDYPNDHKKYFSTMVELMSKMRSTLAAYKNILNRFRPRKTKKGTITHDPTSLHEGPHSKDLFGWEVYRDSTVKEVYNRINGFLNLASDIYQEAIEIIKEEESIRSNPDEACPRFDRSYQRSAKAQQKIIEVFDKNDVNIDNEIVTAMETAEDVRQLIASLFHTLSTAEFNFFCVCHIISEGRKAGLTTEEALLFGKDNKKKVIRVRTLLDHIVELIETRVDAIGWKGMLDGEFVMHLLCWCGWDGSKNNGLLNYVTRRCEGKIRVVKMGAVMAEKRKLTYKERSEIRALQDDFNKQMDDFVDSILAKQAQERA